MAEAGDVLIFAEDPGPAQYAAPLPEALAAPGWHAVVYAAGLARDFLRRRHIPFVPVDGSMTPASILDQVKPRCLLTGTSENPDSLGLHLIHAAQRSGIATAAFIDAGVNAVYRFRGRADKPLAYAPDWILVPDEWTRAEFIRIGANPDRTVVCGHPHYDYVLNLSRTWTAQDRERMRERLLPGLLKHQRVVVFLSEGSDRLRLLSSPPSPGEYTMQGRGQSTGRTEMIIEELLEAVQTLTPRPYLVLRLHPKDEADDFQAYAAEFNHIDQASPPLELVFCADLVVGMTSMLLMEAALLGRPTLSIVPRAVERDWLPTVRQGVTPCVMYRADLGKALADPLRNGSSAPADLRASVPESSLQLMVDFVNRIMLQGRKANS
jgi:hypothetical protein